MNTLLQKSKVGRPKGDQMKVVSVHFSPKEMEKILAIKKPDCSVRHHLRTLIGLGLMASKETKW